MKKLIYILTIIGFQSIFGQAHRYSDLGVLFSQKELNGTARYTGLSGAMGALGGDISVINQNPAGLAVFNHNDFSISMGTNNKSAEATYYGNTSNSDFYDFKFNQIGLAFVFDQQRSDWEKVILAINYQKTKNFDNVFNVLGNSGFASFNKHPNPETLNDFNQGITQDFSNETSGNSSLFSIGLASEYKKQLYIGASVNFHSIDMVQEATLLEINENSIGEQLDALFYQYDSNVASGISLNLGFIYKATQNIRLGFSYESPTTFYNIINETNIFDGRITQDLGRAIGNNKDHDLDIKGDLDILPLYKGGQGYTTKTERLEVSEYNLRTPHKLTASTAIILGKSGLLSLDYSYHTYKTTKLSGEGGGFSSENSYFSNVLTNTHNIKAGGEMRLQNWTFRGGISYEQSPFDKNKTSNIDVIRLGNKYGASLGTGIRIENHKVDISYNYSQQKNTYDAYDNYDQVNPIALNLKQSNINFGYTYIF